MDGYPKDLCTDCGFRVVWWYASDSHLCRWCYVKSGYSPFVEIDPDLLLAVLGSRERAMEVLYDAAGSSTSGPEPERLSYEEALAAEAAKKREGHTP